jgi:hypothetical protein
MEELICDINDVSALSDFEDITFYLPELQNITFIEKCFRILVVFGGIPLKCIVVLLLIYSHQFYDPWVGHPIFRSAISFLKCALLFQCVLEQVIVINRDHLVCRILILIAPTPIFYFFVLLIPTVVAINRYLNIIRCERYDIKQFVYI